jgi:hypothetical protein
VRFGVLRSFGTLPTFPSRRTPPTGIGLPPGSSGWVHSQEQGVAGDPGVLPTASPAPQRAKDAVGDSRWIAGNRQGEPTREGGI